MRSLIFTTVGSLAISLIALTGISNKIGKSISKESIELSNLHNSFDLSQVFKPVYNKAITIEDIKVYEIEEEIIIDFDVKQHLPKDFNPYQNVNNSNQ